MKSDGVRWRSAPQGFERLAWVFSIALSLSASVAAAQPAVEQDTEYQRLVASALQAFEAGQWLEARARFRSVHAVEPSARTFRAIGYASFELGDYAEAFVCLSQALTDTRRPLTATQRQDASALLARTEGLVGRIHVQLTPTNASVLVDDAPASRLAGVVIAAAGRRRVTVQAEGYVSTTQIVDVLAQETHPLRVALEAVAVPEPEEEEVAEVAESPAPVAITTTEPRRSPLGFVVLGGGGAVAVVGGVFLALGARDASSVEGAPDGSAYASVHDAYGRASRRVLLGSIVGGVGLAAVATGVVLTVRGGAESDALTLQVSPSGVSVGGSF